MPVSGTNPIDPQAVSERAKGRWILDPTVSTVRFAQRAYWGLATVRGAFTVVSGQGVLLSNGGVSGSLHVSAASVNTSVAKRDAHLRTADYFDVDHFPTIDFVANRLELFTGASSAEAHIAGELTVRGTTRPLRVVAEISEARSETLRLVTRVTLARKDFGIVANKLGMVKEHTTLTVTAEFIRPRQ